MRKITHTYQDPLELIWIAAAKQMGITIRRDSTVFASWDGKGVLTIGSPETLDADDSLAQMVLHECCHALVEGPPALQKPDWGLDITDSLQRVREHACLRLQAALADQYGLREFLGSTTSLRTYYDQLPENPLAPTDEDPAVEIALPGWQRATTGPWAAALDQALKLTAEIAQLLKQSNSAPEGSLWTTAKVLD
ncbi:MAG: hypothetical protein COA78_20080 [Blastopirellula sp.]|nr:MAG: hypothetical protein COA78_20080 [Blastopirellula sp.]